MKLDCPVTSRDTSQIHATHAGLLLCISCRDLFLMTAMASHHFGLCMQETAYVAVEDELLAMTKLHEQLVIREEQDIALLQAMQ